MKHILPLMALIALPAAAEGNAETVQNNVEPAQTEEFASDEHLEEGAITSYVNMFFFA